MARSANSKSTVVWDFSFFGTMPNEILNSSVIAVSDAELASRLQEAGMLHRAAVELCQQRAGRLQKTLDVAEHVHSMVSDISSQLSHIHDDSVAVHGSTATDRATIQQHLTELQVTVSYRDVYHCLLLLVVRRQCR